MERKRAEASDAERLDMSDYWNQSSGSDSWNDQPTRTSFHNAQRKARNRLQEPKPNKRPKPKPVQRPGGFMKYLQPAKRVV
jgi:hypothetical protein